MSSNYRHEHRQQNTRDRRISGIDDIDTSARENTKSKAFLAQNIQELQNTMKRPKLKIIGIDIEESQLRGPENIFSKILEENFPNVKGRDAYKCTRSLQTK